MSAVELFDSNNDTCRDQSSQARRRIVKGRHKLLAAASRFDQFASVPGIAQAYRARELSGENPRAVACLEDDHRAAIVASR